MGLILVILVIVAAIAGILYYLGIKIRNLLESFQVKLPKYVYWVSYYFIFATVIFIHSGLVAFYEAAAILFVICDLLRIIGRITGIKGHVVSKIYFKGITVVIVSLLISVIWQYHALHPVVTEYEISLENKIEGGLEAVFISDLHAGTAICQKQLGELEDTVNKMKPDILFLGGDIFDESSSMSDIEDTCKIIEQIHTKYGVYYISGNHDTTLQYDYQNELKEAGVHIINDEAVLVDEKFYVVGRQDEGMYPDAQKRKNVKELIQETTDEYPVIMLDHRPEYFKEDTGSQVDLLLCGHTHNGQIFPGNLLIGLFCDQAYGYERHNGTHVIVSSGYGVWGYPIRSESRSELVRLHID